MDQLKGVLDAQTLRYGVDLDLALYSNNKRKSLTAADLGGHPPDTGFVRSKDVWKLHRERKASIRLRKPQEYCDELWALMSRLESHWGSFAGSNIYVTPPGAQGFAPHWDDVDAYILQV